MPSTFTPNLGIELPADGELDGSWGVVTNDNMSILDRGINGVLSLSLSGTTSTLTTSDGALSDGQYKLLVLTGSPSGTHTITLSPNDAEKIYFVHNTTAQSVVFTQGSGGNVTIATGDSGIIYANGGGASAAIANITDHFAMSSVNITGGAINGTAVGATTASTGAFTTLALGGAAITSTAAELNILDGVTATTAELNILDGVTATSAELNILDGVTATTAELNILDGVTATSAELNILDGVTATTAELNILDGVTATTAELNFIDGVTSAIQTQIDAKAPLASPALTGTPTSPTASLGTNTTQIATTAFALQNISITLLGTLTTTSGTTQTLSSLTLTGFAGLLILVDGVSHDNATARHLQLAGQQISTGTGAAAALFNGPVFVLLSSGQSISMVFPDAGTASFRAAATAITTASTSLSFTLNGAGNFDAGTIKVYGIKS